ncbi:hypothetical protein GASC598I20_018400 [Gilliamella apicola SCGC AB-598-I20]|nr:hypothetical protein GASC598I20_018400 [Gilliamella apicola SCGC AB-598-I20]
MVKHDQNLMDLVILDCFASLNKSEQSISERICQYILSVKDLKVVEDFRYS